MYAGEEDILASFLIEGDLLDSFDCSDSSGCDDPEKAKDSPRLSEFSRDEYSSCDIHSFIHQCDEHERDQFQLFSESKVSDDFDCVDHSTNAEAKVNSLVVHAKPKPPLRLKVQLNDFVRGISIFSQAFNSGNIPLLSELFNKLYHRKSLFRLKNPVDMIEDVGTEGVVSFYGKLIDIFPDCVIVTKKPKIFSADKFQVIQTKVEVTATDVHTGQAQKLMCPNAGKSFLPPDLMIVSPEEKIKFYELEMKIRKSGLRAQRHVKAIITQYIDPKSNCVVLTDTTFKLCNFRPV